MTDSRGGWSWLLCGLLVGCGSGATFTPVANPPHDLDSKAPNDVEVFTSPPTRPYTEIGKLTIEKETQFVPDSDPKLVQQLREQAGDEGCDAIVMQSKRSSIQLTESSFAGPEASCIVWNEE
jgi:hypothetical protein